MEPTFTNTSIPASFRVPPNTRTAYAFTIPASAPYLTSDFIYASSDAPPSDLENPHSSFGYHQQKGFFKLDLKGIPGDKPAGDKVVNIPATSSTSISTFCRDSSNSFCLVSIRDEVAATVTFVAYSSLTGWIGFGTGQVMAGSRMFIGWNNGKQAVISQRTTSEYNLPIPVNASIFAAVPLPAGINLPSSIKISFALSVPISSGIASTTSPSDFMFAGSNSTPGTPSVPSSSFRKHEFRGQFNVDVSKLGQSSGEGAGSTPVVDLVLQHGIFMFLGWCVLPPIAIFVARYLKFRLGHVWYLTHTGIMLFGVSACIATALVCVEVNLAPGKTPFITTPHGILGATLCFAIYPMQVVFGFMSNALFNAERECVPWWDRMHWWVGRVAVVLAVVNVQLGLTLFEASSGVVGLFWAFIVLVVVGVGGFVGEYWLKGAVHHVKTGIQSESDPTVHDRLMDDHVEGDEQGAVSRLGHSGSDFSSGEQRV
ncbi:hypothetical protein HDU80_010566 [Chytriomyces hyalinus]|nr:hypothetical protein HDU80_010566 [Chytriomyces hyalinus]